MVGFWQNFNETYFNNKNSQHIEPSWINILSGSILLWSCSRNLEFWSAMPKVWSVSHNGLADWSAKQLNDSKYITLPGRIYVKPAFAIQRMKWNDNSLKNLPEYPSICRKSNLPEIIFRLFVCLINQKLTLFWFCRT